MELPPFPAPELAGPARARAPFLLAGRRALASGFEDRGLRELRIHPWRVLEGLRLAEAEPAHAARVTATGVERLLRVEGRALLERIFVPPAAAAVVLEWRLLPADSGSGPCFDPLDLRLEWTCDLAEPGAQPEPHPRAETSARTLLVVRDAGLPVRAETHDRDTGPVPSTGPGAVRAVAAFTASKAAAFDAQGRDHPGGPLSCSLAVRLLPEETFRLTVAAAPDGAALEQALAGVADPPLVLRAAAAEAARRASSGPALSVASDPQAGLALRWALARLPGFLAALEGPAGEAVVVGGYTPDAPPRASDTAPLPLGLAALVAGDTQLALEAARCALARAEADHAAPGGAAACAALVLFSQHLLWTAEGAPARAAWPRLLALAERAPGATAEAAPLVAAALGQLALAGESLGGAEQAAALRAAASRLARGEAAARALARAGGWDDWLSGAPEAAHERWSRLARSGLGAARALWPGPSGAHDAASAAAVVNGVAFGLLGLEPDAPRARLRLRPQLPAAWEHAAVRSLRLGDAEVMLGYRRLETGARFELEQVSGAVPLRLVLEPVLPGKASEALVDGAPAALAPRPFGSRTLVPVQLMLDERRVLEVRLERAVAREELG